MPPTTCRVGSITIGGTSDETRRARPLTLIAGPCVLEEPEVNRQIAVTVRDLCEHLGLSFIFKASFDKANRSSVRSARGPGLDRGLDELCAIREELGVPVSTDVHEPAQAERAAEVVDLLQVPAFLCRQTDLLAACAATGRAVNVKKGQFIAPSEMRHAVSKLVEGGATEILLTERGTFFGYHRLVNDFIGLGDLMEIGPPVCFDVTHSTQLPGAAAETTGGRPERAALLMRAAIAAGVDAIFVECHPDPARASSDASTQQRLDAMPALLAEAVAMRRALAALDGGDAKPVSEHTSKASTARGPRTSAARGR